MKDLIWNRTKKIARATGMLMLIMSLLVLGVSCEEEGGKSGYNPPGDHTISQDGYMHKSGLNNPLDNCVSCHGADLRGGTTGVSCYECHGQKW